MCGNGTFFSLPSKQADAYLVEIRNALVGEERGDLTILLSALDGASYRRRRSDKPKGFTGVFRAACLEMVHRYPPRFHSFQRDDHASSIFCAWYDRVDYSVIAGATQLQQKVVHAKVAGRKSIYVALSTSEYAAFRLLRFAGENQIVLDSEVWPKLHIHPPQHEPHDERMEEIGQALHNALPSFQIPEDVLKGELFPAAEEG